MFPDFLVIGAQKAGTTWLYRSLRAHPQLWMPREKELHYFDEKIRLRGGLWSRLRGDRPADWRWRRQVRGRFRQLSKDYSLQDLRWDLKYFLRKPDDDWYASLFEQGAGKVTGETTPDYSVLDRETISHVHGLMPEAKIVFMMRNPIERPWSVADMGLRIKGQSSKETPDEVLYQRLNGRRTQQMTNYLRTLKHWGEYYPEEQIFVGFLEDIYFFPEEFLRVLYEFLGVDSSAGYRVIRRKIHSGFQDTMPTRFAVFLAGAYRKRIQRLQDNFGGYATFWHYSAQRLIEDPPREETVPYPLWESRMWDEWREFNEVGLQSGPLSTVRAASR